MSFRHTYVLRFPCSFPQVGRRVSIVHAHVYAYTCAYANIHIYVHMYVYICPHTYVHTYMCVSVCACVENWTWDRVHISKFNFEWYTSVCAVYISSWDRKTTSFELYRTIRSAMLSLLGRIVKIVTWIKLRGGGKGNQWNSMYIFVLVFATLLFKIKFSSQIRKK